MTLWFHPAMDFPDKGDILQISDRNGEYTSYGVMSRRDGKDKLSSTLSIKSD